MRDDVATATTHQEAKIVVTQTIMQPVCGVGSMGSSQSRELLLVADASFAAPPGLDRRRLHDLPWLEALRAMGPIEEEAMESFLAGASDHELACCRALFRAYRRFAGSAAPGDARDFGTALYYTLAQSPNQLLILYSVLHNCWRLRIDALAPLPAPSEAFFAALLASYVEERADMPRPELDAEINVDGMREAMRNMVSSYVQNILNLSDNPEYADAQITPFGTVASGTSVRLWTLRASDASIELQVSDFGASIVSCKIRNTRTGDMVEMITGSQTINDVEERASDVFSKSIWRPAEQVQNSSGATQAFYWFSGRMRARMSFSVGPDATLTVERTAEVAGKELTTKCRWNLLRCKLGAGFKSVDEDSEKDQHLLDSTDGGMQPLSVGLRQNVALDTPVELELENDDGVTVRVSSSDPRVRLCRFADEGSKAATMIECNAPVPAAVVGATLEEMVSKDIFRFTV